MDDCKKIILFKVSYFEPDKLIPRFGFLQKSLCLQARVFLKQNESKILLRWTKFYFIFQILFFSSIIPRSSKGLSITNLFSRIYIFLEIRIFCFFSWSFKTQKNALLINETSKYFCQTAKNGKNAFPILTEMKLKMFLFFQLYLHNQIDKILQSVI